MIKVAIIGLGQMGLIHTSLLNIMPDVKVVSVCDKNKLIYRFAKKAFKNIKVISDIKELSGLGLDAVYVTVPIPIHYPVIKTIISEKIARNIFVEKPLSSSYAESEEMCKLVMNQGINMVGYNWRFAITFSKAKQVVEEGVLGNILHFETYAYSPIFFGIKSQSKTQSKSVLPELGCHAVDLAIWFFGELEVEKSKIESIVSTKSEDSANIEVSTLKGLKGEIKTSWCMERHVFHGIGVIIKGSEGTLMAEVDRVELKLNDGRSNVWYNHDLVDKVPFLLPRADYFREDETFIKAIKEEHPAEPNFMSALAIDRIIDQARKKA
jgi:predicted dehydrogenase